MNQYEKLFSPGKIGKLEIKNRVVMPAMETALNSATGEASDRIISFYEERAMGGCGLIITEITRIANGAGIGHYAQLNATSINMLGGLERLANAAHRHGAKIFTQLHHPGREGREMITGTEIVGPSAIRSKSNEEVPRELTEEEIGEIVTQFITGAKLCEIAGIDGVELHGAHGYLIQQFMCEYSNQRTDRYGGDFQKRMQFVTELVMGIKMVCGEDYPVCIRINGDDYIQGGMGLEDAVEIAKYLEAIGVDAINVSAGGYGAPNESTEPISYEQGWKRHLAKRIKSEVSIPVIACDVIRKPDFAEKLLIEDDLDFVALGRAQLADPKWCSKSQEGKEKDIRPCISCLYCAEEIGGAKSIKCAVNPRTAFETVYQEPKPDGNNRLVVVIGGGPAGMQAAITLAKRQFKVVLFEQKDELGGYVKIASVPPHKDKLLWLIDNMSYQMQNAGVDVRLNTTVSIDEIKEMDPYAVFVAVGGIPIIPSLPGCDLNFVYGVDDVLGAEFALANKNVVVVGSGLTGLEVAEFIAVKGNKVTVIEKEDKVAPGAGVGPGADISPNVLDIIKRLNELDVEILTSTEFLEVTCDHKMMIKEQDEAMNVDAVVLALGVRPNNTLAKAFLENFDKVFVLGDALRQGRVADAIRTAYERAYFL